MPSLTAEELRGNRSQWLYAVDVLIETQGEVCLLPLPGDAAEQLFPSVRFRVRERSVNAKIIGRFSPFLMSAIGH